MALARFVAVSAAVAPMAKLPAGVGTALDAVRLIDDDVPSGSVNWICTVEPSGGLVPPKSIDSEGGEPEGPVTVAPAMLVLAPAIWKPNGCEGSSLSSVRVTTSPAAVGCCRRPRPSEP